MIRLEAHNLCKTYRQRAVVDNVSVNVTQGEIVGLLGPNGAGKTTTFYMITGLIRPDSGHILLDGLDITQQPMYRRGQLGIGYLAQEASVFRELSVEDNILAVLELATKLTHAERKARAETLMEEFSITHIRKSRGKVLSGGERRRTEIARALAVNPKFILLDEPFAGIDPIAKGEIQDLVLALKQRNIGVLITDHDAQATLGITDRAYLLYQGKILEAGTSVELAEDARVRELYLGKDFKLNR
ncbi:MAG: LPS export ABC transporter ATP-binding protein [Saprospiraceae bacterium]|nr:LPS export ABC transporter ATP-binding protein [Saprospiraceae bacterium]